MATTLEDLERRVAALEAVIRPACPEQARSDAGVHAEYGRAVLARLARAGVLPVGAETLQRQLLAEGYNPPATTATELLAQTRAE